MAHPARMALLAWLGLAGLSLAAAAPARDLGSRIGQIESELARDQQELELISIPYVGGQIEAYEVSEVERLVASTKADLLRALEGDDLAALRAYVEGHYPEPQLDAVRGNGSLASAESVSAALRPIAELLAKVKRVNLAAVSVELLSEPGRATFSFWPRGTAGTRRQTGSTGSKLSLYRGLYRYRVEKARFRAIEAELNLVDNDVRALDCKLDPVESVPCRFDVQ